MKKVGKNCAYIDGSYNPRTETYGCGGFLVDHFGKKHIIQANGNDSKMCKMRNVAGEILGAKEAVRIAQKLKMKNLTIYYDYKGIESWITGRWKTNKKETKEYVDYMLKAMNAGLNIYFKHIKGHSGNEGNEIADQLAKLAVGLFIK